MPDTAPYDQFDPERVCRVCLREADDFYFIYDEAPVEQGANIAQILNECTRYTCERYDKMPHHMCDTCIKAACQAYRFKRDAEKAYRSLVAILGCTAVSKPNSRDICTQTELSKPMLPCGICDDTFLDILELRLHRNREHKHLEEKDLKCRLCDAQFQQLRQLRKHLLKHHDPQSPPPSLRRILQCPECRSIFSRRDHLLRHLRLVHNMDKLDGRRRREKLPVEREQDSSSTAWAPIDETTMQSGDELESTAVLFNHNVCSDEDEGDNNDCHYNPISSNEDADDEEVDAEAKQSLWLHVKPEPETEKDSGTRLDAEPDLEQYPAAVAALMKLDKFRKKTKLESARGQVEGEVDKKTVIKGKLLEMKIMK